MDVEVILLDILGNAHQQVLMVVEIIGLVSVDLIYESLGVDTLLDCIGHIFAAEDSELLDGGIILLDRSVQRIGAAHRLAGERIESAVTHGAEPVRCDVCIFQGGDQHAKRSSCGTGCGRDMPVFVLLGILGCFFVHPVSELVLGQERELIEILSAVIVVGGSSALLKTCAVERNLVSGFHEFMNTFVLLLKDPLIILAVDGLLLDFRVSGKS